MKAIRVKLTDKKYKSLERKYPMCYNGIIDFEISQELKKRFRLMFKNMYN